MVKIKTSNTSRVNSEVSIGSVQLNFNSSLEAEVNEKDLDFVLSKDESLSLIEVKAEVITPKAKAITTPKAPITNESEVITDKVETPLSEAEIEASIATETATQELIAELNNKTVKELQAMLSNQNIAEEVIKANSKNKQSLIDFILAQ